MKDWKAIAKLTTPDIPTQDLDRLVAPLTALEEAFRPLVRGLTSDVEPVTGFHIEKASE